MTDRKRRQNLVKCCSVSLRSWMNQWNCSEVNVQAQGLGNVVREKVCEMWYVSEWFFLIIVQSGLKLHVRSHRYSCGSWNERVCNRSLTSHNVDNGAIMCLFDRTEDRSNIFTWTINFIQLTKTRLRRWSWGTLEFTILLFYASHKTQLFLV